MRQRGQKHTPVMIMAALCFFALAGCSNRAHQIAVQPTLSQAELLSGQALFDLKITNLKLPDVAVMDLSDTMRNYLHVNIPKKASKAHKLNRLLFLMFSKGNLGISYDPTLTLTAENTFRSGSGNCLAVSYLFARMAEELGLHAEFQNVHIPPKWSMENDVMYKYRHVNIKVTLPDKSTYIVDVNMKDTLPSYKTNLISKQNAVAQYYSNKGAEYLAKEDNLNAFLNFKKAITIESGQSEFWSNLGVLYSKAGKYNYAESAYLTALNLQQDNLTTISNIASLYERMGRDELMLKYQRLAESHNNKNPYFRFIKAKDDFENGNYSNSLSHLEWALKHEKNDPEFYFLLAQIYEKTSQPEKAQSATLKGQKIAGELQHLLTDKAMIIKSY